jgi:hypothetical protein
MADRKARGLPETFSLNTAHDLPVAVGDFLDEEDVTKNQVLARRRVAPPPPEEPAAAPRVAAFTQGIDVAPPSPSTPRSVAEPRAAISEPARPVPERSEPQPERPKRSSLHPAWKRPRRKQLNLSAEAERMLEGLLRHFQQYGPQEDIKMSELFEALVIVANRSMDRLNLGELPRRGAWGSQTEKNFPIAIGEALARAIVEEYARWGTGENA